MIEDPNATDFGDDKKPIANCLNCSNSFLIENLQQTCGNCFACSGCKIYLCPVCKSEIVVTPINPMGSRKR
jgi:hypothetical protein